MVKLFLYTSSLIIFFLASCNSCNHNPDEFTEQACPTVLNEGAKRSADVPPSINVFLETSGSMFGFMPANTATNFQTDMWRLISSLNSAKKKGLSIYQVKDTNNPVKLLDIGSFREKMNSGEFQAATSTDIPLMLDSVLARTDKNSVSILISDLIFSPEEKGNTAPKLSQVTTDIRARFEGKGLSSVIFHFNSDFKGRSANPKQSPYYVWIIGKESAVLNIASTVKSNFPKNEQIDFGISARHVDGTIVPGINTSGNALAVKCQEDNRYYAWSEYNDEGLEFYLALNLSNYPNFVQDPNYLRRNLEIESSQAELQLVSVETREFKTKINSSDNKLLQQLGATHLLKYKLKNAYEEEAVVQFRIKNELPKWIAIVNSPTDDLSRTKTFGLVNMIKGLDEAYKGITSAYISQPFKIWISKNSID